MVGRDRLNGLKEDGTEMNSVSYSIGGGRTIGEREKEQMREHT